MNIGIYGGAFDPIHKEHKKIIEKSYSELNLDKLILLPSYSPPHKSNKFSPFHVRVKMLETQTENLSYVEIDQREFNLNNKKNCSYEVLQQIKSDYPEDELVYIIGGDSMVKFHTWVHPEIISKIMPIAVVAREGYEGLEQAITHAINNYGASIKVLSFIGEDISSSDIKAKYEFKETSPLVSPKVNEIIIENGLYHDFSIYINKLKNSVTKELFEHCKGVVFYALKLANKLDLGYEEVFLSALLHDCAKERQSFGKQYEKYPHKIIHQYYGAYIAQTEYGITNKRILNAIKYHTTGKKDMNKLEKLIYCADMLEYNRVYDGVKNLRKIIENDFERGFVACIEASLNRLKQSKRDVYYLTQECYEYYKNK